MVLTVVIAYLDTLTLQGLFDTACMFALPFEEAFLHLGFRVLFAHEVKPTNLRFLDLRHILCYCWLVHAFWISVNPYIAVQLDVTVTALILLAGAWRHPYI